MPRQQHIAMHLILCAGAVVTSADDSFAQTHARSYGGWRPSTSATATQSAASRPTARRGTPDRQQPAETVQTAYFQAQSSLSDVSLPSLPLPQSPTTGSAQTSSGGLPALPNYASPSNASPNAPANAVDSRPGNGYPGLPSSITPSQPNTGSSRGISTPLPSATNPPSRIPASTVSSALRNGATQPNGAPQPNGVTNAGAPNASSSRGPVGLPVSPAGVNSGSAQGASRILPPGQPAAPRPTNTANANALRSGTPQVSNQGRRVPGQSATFQQPASAIRDGTQGSNDLRTINRDAPGTGRASQPIDPRTVATGYPYVSPAPGRYATSPYNHAFFQNAAYQRQQASIPVQGSGAASVPARTVAANTGNTVAVPQGQSVPVTNNLPQYQYGPGIYPTAYQCAVPTPSVPTTGAVPGTYVPPVFTQNVAPALYAPDNAGYAPLFSLGQENYNVQIGRGIIGQPTVYVAGQPIRNFLRYLSP